jgi:hypothetical protein
MRPAGPAPGGLAAHYYFGCGRNGGIGGIGGIGGSSGISTTIQRSLCDPGIQQSSNTLPCKASLGSNGGQTVPGGSGCTGSNGRWIGWSGDPRMGGSVGLSHPGGTGGGVQSGGSDGMGGSGGNGLPNHGGGTHGWPGSPGSPVSGSPGMGGSGLPGGRLGSPGSSGLLRGVIHAG